MKSAPEITHEIDQIIHAHYYSEDFELIASLRAYIEGLMPGEKETVRGIVLKRVLEDGSLVDILLCSVIDVPSAVPALAGKLDREPVSNQMTRGLIAALRNYQVADAYTAVERFVDSDQEMEAIEALADMDFRRTIPLIVRLMRKEHYHGNILHILHRRMKKTGADALVGELRESSATRSDRFRNDLALVLDSKKPPYNPFTGAEIRHMLSGIQ